MNFWKALRWVGAVIFIALVVAAWQGADRRPHDSVTKPIEPPPVPTFR
jgi:hypothetical protein